MSTYIYFSIIFFLRHPNLTLLKIMKKACIKALLLLTVFIFNI